MQCVRAAVKKKDSYLQAHYVEVRRGNTAILALAASMLTAIFHMLRDVTM